MIHYIFSAKTIVVNTKTRKCIKTSIVFRINDNCFFCTKDATHPIVKYMLNPKTNIFASKIKNNLKSYRSSNRKKRIKNIPEISNIREG